MGLAVTVVRGVVLPIAVALGRCSGSTGAALSRPVTPSTLPDSELGTEMALSLARSWYGPALTPAVARYSLSWVWNAASMADADPVPRT